MRRLLLLFGLSLLFTVGACERPTQDDCDEACKRVKDLAKADFDKRTAGLPEALVREGWVATAEVMDEIVTACSAACMDVGDKQLTTCLSGAADQDTWKACLAKDK